MRVPVGHAFRRVGDLWLPPGACAFNAGVGLGGAASVALTPFVTGITPNEGFGDGGEAGTIHITAGGEDVNSVTFQLANGTSVGATITAKTPDSVDITIPQGSLGLARVIVKLTDGRVVKDDSFIPVRYDYTSDPESQGIGTVTTLAELSKTGIALTVDWDEVTDGVFSYADHYQVRLSTDAAFASDPTTNWALFDQSADVDGVGPVGNTLSHQFTGLQPGTTYYVAIVAYEGTLGVDAIFGSISSAVTITTDAGVETPSIISVTTGTDTVGLTSSAFVGPGSHQHSDWQLDAVGENFSTPLIESLDDSTNKITITLDASSLVDGTDYIVRVRHNDSTVGDSEWSASVQFTYQESVGGLWPNQPGDHVTIATLDLTGQAVRSLVTGEKIGNWKYSKRKTTGKVIADSTTPIGNNRSLEGLYPEDRVNEFGDKWMSEPFVMQFNLGLEGFSNYRNNATELYFAWVWKRSSNWFWHPVGDKITFLFRGSGNGQLFTGQRKGNRMRAVWEPEAEIHDGAYTFVPGDWYQGELYLTRPDPPGSSGTGTIKTWVSRWLGSAWGAATRTFNGTYTADAKDDVWRMCELSGTFGGAGDPDLTSDQFLYWAAARVSGKIP